MEARPYRRGRLLRRFLPPLRDLSSRRGAIFEPGFSLTYNGYEQDKTTPTYGGYSTRITVDENYMLSIPKGIPLERAAPLLCAGITTYSPLRHFGLEAGDKWAWSAWADLAIWPSVRSAMGAHVTVLSHSPGKRDDALALGADDFLVTKDEAVFEKNANRFDFIIDTISATHDDNAYLNLLRRDGIMVLGDCRIRRRSRPAR